MEWDFSVAKFGSTVRQDNDLLSDSDLLVVIENDKNFDFSIVSEYLEGNGHNISYYNYDKLVYLSKKGSLFLQHLKQESEIIYDKKGRFACLLKKFNPKNDYEDEMYLAKKQFQLIKSLPETNLSNLWYCDYLYVLLRNYLVFYSANSKNYIFSFKTLLRRIMSDYDLSDNTYNILLRLRNYKFEYRSNNQIDISKEIILELVIELNKIGLATEISFTTQENFIRIMKNKIYTLDVPNYYKLRLQEGMYKSFNLKNVTLDNIFSNPQFYTPKYNSMEYIKKTMTLIEQAHNIGYNVQLPC